MLTSCQLIKAKRRSALQGLSSRRRLVAFGVESEVPAGEEDLDQRPDGEGVDHRAHSESAAQDPTEGEHRDFDEGPGQADRGAPFGDAGHQTVPRSWPEVGPDVHAAGDAYG